MTMTLHGCGSSFAALAVIYVGAAQGVADASIPDASGAIHACYSLKDGALRVIDTDAGQTCGGKETPLSWSQTGMPSLTYVYAYVPAPPGGFLSGTAVCPNGLHVVGGGVLAPPASYVYSSFPSASDWTSSERSDPRGNDSWTAGTFNPTPYTSTAEVFAICTSAQSVVGPN
jgi:hypothetical protein